MDALFAWIDPVVGLPFLVFGHASWAGFLGGTAVLALACTLIGELTMLGTRLWLKEPLREREEKVKRYHDLSIKALEHGDRASFKAVDKLAKEAYGQSFTLGLCLGLGQIWPCFFALGWMQFKFGYQMELPLPFRLPFLGRSIGYVGVFVVVYVLVRVGYGLLKRRLRKAPPTPGGNSNQGPPKADVG